MEEKTVVIKVVSNSGHDVLEMAPMEALSELKEQVHSNHKWCVVDGEAKNVDMLTQADLLEATNIVLTDKLVGGQ